MNLYNFQLIIVHRNIQSLFCVTLMEYLWFLIQTEFGTQVFSLTVCVIINKLLNHSETFFIIKMVMITYLKGLLWELNSLGPTWPIIDTINCGYYH